MDFLIYFPSAYLDPAPAYQIFNDFLTPYYLDPPFIRHQRVGARQQLAKNLSIRYIYLIVFRDFSA